MARTINQIQEEILQAKAQEPALADLNSTSKTAVWRLWIYITAFAIWSLEKIFDKHLKEVNHNLSELKPHTARWYRNKALAFQDKFDLLPDSDKFDNENFTDEQIENSKIVKYSAVVESEDESRLIIKIATENNNELQPITSEQKARFKFYIQRIKDAGVRTTVINYQPDILKLHLKIFINPLVLDENGVDIYGKKPVEIALKNYLKKLPFNGELILAHLIDELQRVKGVKIPHLVLAESKWIDASVDDYGDFQPIEIKQIPISGYYKIEDFANVEYIVE